MSPEPVTSHGAAAARGASGQLPDRSHVLKVVFKSEQVLAPSRAGSHAPRAPQLRVAMPLRHLPPALSAWYTGTAARLRQSRRDMSTRGMGPSEAGGVGFPKWPCVGRRSAGRGERGRRDGQPQAQKPHQPHRLHRPPTRHDHGRAGARPAARDEAAAEGRGQAQTGAHFRHSESAARPRRGRSSSGSAPSAGEADASSRATRGRAGGRSCGAAPGADPAILERLGNSQLPCDTSSEA